MRLLSHPFRLERNGTVATVEDDTDAAYAEGIAVLALTRQGERPLCPRFGLRDPLYDRVALADLNLGLTDYGPPVTITSATTTAINDVAERVVLTYAPQD